jgi:hypothetical protein
MSNFIMQGMTRDGTFLIENGKISSPITNFRFNQSMAELLKSVETGRSRTARGNGRSRAHAASVGEPASVSGTLAGRWWKSKSPGRLTAATRSRWRRAAAKPDIV